MGSVRPAGECRPLTEREPDWYTRDGVSNADFPKEDRDRPRFVTKDDAIAVKFTTHVVYGNVNALGEHMYHCEMYRKFRPPKCGPQMDVNRYIEQC